MLQNNEINLLPAFISEKIAAGEVVDRPLSAAKELLENALDAGADTIIIEIKNGGKTYIRVTDNGMGISTNQVSKAFMRHATSKIQSIEDLQQIRTLGFRGEALTSIAAVSKVEIVTKTKEEKTGTRMVIEGGNILLKDSVGCPEGTTVIVTDLFYNTPARLKFMKTDGAEGSLIIDFVSKMALAYPHIRFRVINNGVALFATRGNGDIYNNILTIYSKQIGSRLIEVNEMEGDYHLRAFLSPPDISRPTRKGQVYFVNGRSVSNKVLEAAVAVAYRERIPDGRNPLVYLFLHVPPHRVDVNIHPNKKEVRFDDNDYISQFIINGFRRGLRSTEGLATLNLKELPKEVQTNKPEIKDEPQSLVKDSQVDIKSLLYTLRGEIDLSQQESEKNPEPQVMENPADYSQTVGGGKTLYFEDLKPLGSIFGTYILAADDAHFYMIDQHAAHERVFYEKLLTEFEKAEKNTQLLIAPQLMETTPAAASISDLWMENLNRMGFIMEPFGTKSFLVKGIPSFMELEEAKSFLEEYLDSMGSGDPVMDEKKLDKIITRACKTAVKANDLLDMSEIRYLLKELSRVKDPFSCPHGRPTLLMLSRQDIERMFKRA